MQSHKLLLIRAAVKKIPRHSGHGLLCYAYLVMRKRLMIILINYVNIIIITWAIASPSSLRTALSLTMSNLLPINMMTTSSWAYSLISASHACKEITSVMTMWVNYKLWVIHYKLKLLFFKWFIISYYIIFIILYYIIGFVKLGSLWIVCYVMRFDS